MALSDTLGDLGIGGGGSGGANVFVTNLVTLIVVGAIVGGLAYSAP